MNIKRNIIFALESRKKDGVLIVENVPIRMRVNFASQRIEFTTGYRIDAAKWDADKQRVKNGCTNKLKQSSSEINVALLGYYTELQEVFKRFEVAEVLPSPADVKNAFNARHRSDDVQVEWTSDKPDPSNDFYKAFDEFVRVCGRQNDWTHATYEKFAAVKNHLRAFRADLSFSFFNEAGLTEYVRYLREVREMRNSTIGKQLSFLKWFLRWSFGQGMHRNNAYDTFRPKLKDTQKKIGFESSRSLQRSSHLIVCGTSSSSSASQDCDTRMSTISEEATSRKIISKSLRSRLLTVWSSSSTSTAKLSWRSTRMWYLSTIRHYP